MEQYRPALYAAAVLAGVFLHIGFFNRGEHHMYGLRYVQLFILLLIGTTGALSLGYSLPLASALALTASLAGSVLLGLYSSLLFYRLAWHPLRRFPGPVAARVTSLWWSTRVAARFDAHKKALGLFNRYGPFVRVGSGDLMLAHPLAVPAVHGPQSRCRKASWYDEDMPRQSLHVTRDHQFHHERRRVWGPSFSDKALRGYEERIVVYVRSLSERLAEYAGQPANASRWFGYFGFDVMGDLAFGRDFGMLRSGQQHWAVALLDEALNVQGLKLPTWLFRILIAVPGLTDKYWKFIAYCDEQLAAKMADDSKLSAQAAEDLPSLMSALLAHAGPSPTPHDLLTLQSDSRTIIVAGSDTTAATLSHVFYQLASHPEHVDKLREELRPLRDADGSFRHAAIYQAEHLNAVINETLRLSPVPPTALVRRTPPEGITVDGTFIPGNTNVWTPQYVIGRSEAAYERAYDFVPERWYSRPEMIREKAGYAPFSAGPYGCIGRPLALMQLRLVIADLVLRFDISYPSGKNGAEFIDNVKDRFTWGLADLHICFTPRAD